VNGWLGLLGKPLAQSWADQEGRQMKLEDVTQIVGGLGEAGITVWVDGGWCVDALIGHVTRDHSDLDIAVDHSDEEAMLGWLTERGFAKRQHPDDLAWNYVLQDAMARSIDVHVFEFDDKGDLTYGIAYPHESLTGQASLGGISIHCIPAEWMFRFKTGYDPAPKDLADVRALADLLGCDIPSTHR